MHIRFLLGPAGSGKTHRCLTEIRAELAASPEGGPLIFLAPKQATFQLERQLLVDPALAGYTRLQILSFERLAEYVFETLQLASPELLNDEGRVMVLRALLARKAPQLKLFRATARLPGLAQQLSLLLREMQRHQLSEGRLMKLAQEAGAAPQLRDKLHDLALLLGAYSEWLREHKLQDATHLLDAATAALRSPSKLENPRSRIALAGLWLDGFAEMTPQELDLLAALAPYSERMTLAFCLEAEPSGEDSWLSIWSAVSKTFRRCHQRLKELAGGEVLVEVLERRPEENRFAGNPILQHLERCWANPQPFEERGEAARPAAIKAGATPADGQSGLRVVVCANPEAETVFAAREILRFARNGGRFRETAVLLRQLEKHHELIRRIFTRYEIPFFLDRREPVAHHPLAELTRFALRTVAFGWRAEDWFGALKTGLVSADEGEIDWLENRALAHDWEGDDWRHPLEGGQDEGERKKLEQLRQKLMPPFQQLANRLTRGPETLQPTGAQLAAALREFWRELKVEEQLDTWSAESPADKGPSIQVPQSQSHATVWDQMEAWLDNLERAFPAEALALREWLLILEAGLGALTVGVVPPALDQVLIGEIDRSRNPDLKLAFVLGVNESVFPAAPAPSVLLTPAERAELEKQSVQLGPNLQEQLGRERYYGYVACTRARQGVVLTCAARDMGGAVLNPSPFLPHLRRLFHRLKFESMPVSWPWKESEHASELAGPLLQAHGATFASGGQNVHGLGALGTLPVFVEVLAKWRQVAAAQIRQLSPAAAQKIYGPELNTSVSGLEDFAACPFKFFVARGLRAEEREEFAVDSRERGSFQHEALNQFHRRVQAEAKRWRDLSPAEARAKIRQVGEELLPTFRRGLFAATPAGRFTGEILIEGLEQLIETLIGWMGTQYEFDPRAVEVEFGLPGSQLPAWRLDLGDGRALLLRGRIDRVDLWRDPRADEALAVVIDYKSRARKFDPRKLHHGLELQLLAYLGVLRHLADPQGQFDAGRLRPAGVFYVGLSGARGAVQTRAEGLEGGEAARKEACQHAGRFDGDALDKFDNRGVSKGDQFKYAKNADGAFSRRGNEAMGQAEFLALLDGVEGHLRRIGRSVYAGEVAASPYRINNETACDFCDYRSICRFDPWREPYNVLRAPPKEKGPGPPEKRARKSTK